MSIAKNDNGQFMPHAESRRATAVLAINGAELVLDVNGDNHAVMYLDGGAAALTTTYTIEGSPDGANYFSLLGYPYSPASAGGTLPLAAQPMVSEAVGAVASWKRMLCVSVGGLRKIRVRLIAATTGALTAFINSDESDCLLPYVREQKAATLMVSTTAVVSTGLTATLPAVTGLRHYIDRISVVRSATAALTPTATPALVTTTNLPGNPALSFGQDAAGVGLDKEAVLDFGGAGLAALAAGAATTVVCPVYTGVIWRINVAYRLGL